MAAARRSEPSDRCRRSDQLILSLAVKGNRDRNLLAGRDRGLGRLGNRLAVPHDFNLHGVDVLYADRICGVTKRRSVPPIVINWSCK